MIDGILESYWTTESNGTAFKWDYARCSAKCLQERTIIILPNATGTHTTVPCCAYNYLHSRRSQLASMLVQMKPDAFCYDFDFGCLICVRWVTTCCICWICCISEISYYGLGGWVGGWDKLRSYYGMILTFDNYGRPLSRFGYTSDWIISPPPRRTVMTF